MRVWGTGAACWFEPCRGSTALFAAEGHDAWGGARVSCHFQANLEQMRQSRPERHGLDAWGGPGLLCKLGTHKTEVEARF